MERAIKERSILDEFCEKFCKIVDKYTQYIIVSGFVAIASGRVRGTEDIDMIIAKISKEKLVLLHEELLKAGFICVQSDDASVIYDYLQEKISVRYTYQNMPVPEMEMKFAKDFLDDYQLQTRQKLPLTGLNVWFSSINMNVAFKEQYLKSDKDLEDAKHLRVVFKDQINEDEIRKITQLINKYRLGN